MTSGRLHLPPEHDPLLQMMAAAEVMVPESEVTERIAAAVAAERERIRQLVVKHDARTLQGCDGSGNCAGQVHVIQALSRQAARGGHWVPFADLLGDGDGS